VILYSFLIVLSVAAILGLLLYVERVLHAETRRQLFTVMDLEQKERQRRELAEANLARAQHGGNTAAPRPSWAVPPMFLFLHDSSLTPPQPPQPRTYSMEEIEGEL
jgi:hypothetical protein